MARRTGAIFLHVPVNALDAEQPFRPLSNVGVKGLFEKRSRLGPRHRRFVMACLCNSARGNGKVLWRADVFLATEDRHVRRKWLTGIAKVAEIAPEARAETASCTRRSPHSLLKAALQSD